MTQPTGGPGEPAGYDADKTVTFGAVGLPQRAEWDVSVAGTEVADMTETVVLLPQEVVSGAPRVEPAVPAPAAEQEPEGAAEPVRKDSVGRASVIMAMGSLVSRILGFGRQYLFAQVVAASIVGDAFNVANTMPNYLLMVLNAGVLNALLIPQITAAMKHDDGGQVFVDKLLTAAFGAILGLAVIGTVATPWLVDWTSSLSGAALHLSILFGYICLPQIFFYGLYSVLGNVLNARNRFAAFMWAPALANVVQIVGLIAFLHQWGQQTNPSVWTPAMVWTLAGTTTLGIVMQAFVLVPPLVASGFRYRPRFGLRGSGLGSASKMAGWTVSALLFSLGGGLVVQWVLTNVVKHQGAGGEAVGGLTSYNYAMLIFALPHGLITVSILTALFPQMARVWQAGDVREMRRLCTRALSTPAVAIIPSSAGLFVLAEPLVHVMLRLSVHDAQPVVTALRILSFGILGYGISVLQQRYCFAREEGRHNFLYQGLLTVVQVAFALAALWLVEPYLALPLVALGVVVANWGQSLLWMAVARRQLGGLGLDSVVRLWVRLVIASVLAGGVAWLAVYGMTGFGRSWLLSALTCAVAGLCFGLVFLAASRILHIREVDELLAPVLRRLHLARRLPR
ncbi:putative peptidoglycan lipid II flippase [Luteococcus japonicus]|uniref:Putative peptidoglycan lipid II flippase n=1 Tax=Luteococcus japonicus TaxID=33984 RepID=A0A3N1ZVA7_9ACTN|nr:murein biosynthesis integral membrane protein MurJ [Luteococcus japonicus]ROR54397.1 putative peptidoglycan lipid II flippase [Luteococcus japonicus]